MGRKLTEGSRMERPFSRGYNVQGNVQCWFVMLISGMCDIVNRISSLMASVQQTFMSYQTVVIDPNAEHNKTDVLFPIKAN